MYGCAAGWHSCNNHPVNRKKAFSIQMVMQLIHTPSCIRDFPNPAPNLLIHQSFTVQNDIIISSAADGALPHSYAAVRGLLLLNHIWEKCASAPEQSTVSNLHRRSEGCLVNVCMIRGSCILTRMLCV